MSEPTPSLAATLERYKALGRALLAQSDKIFGWSLLGAIAYYIVSFSLLTIAKQATFSTSAYDVGLYDQAIWLLSRGLAPFTTLKGVNIFGDHFSLNNLLLVPLFWLWHNINMLYIVQTCCLALPALPLFRLAQEKLNNSFLALAVGLSYLLYPAVQNMNLENFHPETLAVLFMVLALYFWQKNNFRLYYPFIALAVLSKEDIGLTAAAFGLYLLFNRATRQHGLATIALGLGWYLAASRLLMPLFNGVSIFAPQPVAYSYWFQPLAQNLSNPGYYLARLLEPATLRYLSDLFLPLLFLPLLNPAFILVTLPALGLNILSGNDYLRSVHFHYNYAVIALIFFALIEGLARARSRFGQKIIPALGLLLLLTSLWSNSRTIDLPLDRQIPELRRYLSLVFSPANQAKREAIRSIPDGASVSANYLLAPHLAHRRQIYMFPNPFRAVLWNMWFKEGKDLPPLGKKIDYIVMLESGLENEERLILDYLRRSPYYKTVRHDGEILVLQNARRPISSSYGANYIYNGRQKGKFSMLYFPGSNYYFRNLLGEELPPQKSFTLDIFGYLFLPEDGRYVFSLPGGNSCSLTIDDRPATGFLKRGAHRFTLKYRHRDGPYSLKLVVTTPAGRSYIIPDEQLFSAYDPELFAQASRRVTRRSRPTNLLRNGGFEKTFTDVPGDWRIECWQNDNAVCAYHVSAGEKRSGRYSALLRHEGSSDSRWVQEIAVKPNTNYQLSGWVKTDNVGHKGAGAFLQTEGAEIRAAQLFGTTGWQFLTAQGKTGYGVKQLKVLCRLGDYGATNSGTAYFDDLEFKEVPDND